MASAFSRAAVISSRTAQSISRAVCSNVRPESKATAAAKREGVEVRLYTVIYEAINGIRSAMEGLLAPLLRETITGRAEVRQVFSIPAVGAVAGCFVTEGEIVRGSAARLLRDHVVVHQGQIDNLRRFKDDVRQVASGYECGVALENYRDIKAGDVIETYAIERVVRHLAAAPARSGHGAAVESGLAARRVA